MIENKIKKCQHFWLIQNVCGTSERLGKAELLEELVALSQVPVTDRAVKVEGSIAKLIDIDSSHTPPLSTLVDMGSGQFFMKLPTKKGLNLVIGSFINVRMYYACRYEDMS